VVLETELARFLYHVIMGISRKHDKSVTLVDFNTVFIVVPSIRCEPVAVILALFSLVFVRNVFVQVGI
jgi:hypothetical protein